jgi:branched-chain amino acid transport system permease protein
MRKLELKHLKNFQWPLLLLLVLVVAAIPVPDFWIYQANYIGIYSITCLGLVLLTGILGLTSFGQAAFVGIGAYSTAYLTLNFDLSPWLSLFIGLSITTLSALVIGLITLRMSGHYLPLATIAWGLSLYYLMGNIDALGKYDGLQNIKSLSIASLNLGQGRIFFIFTWICLILFIRSLSKFLDSRLGRAVRAIKSGSQMPQAMGINTFHFKVLIFCLSALLSSFSGWLLAHFQHSVTPSDFGLKMGIEYLFMTVVGGAGYLWGAVIGAGIYKILDDQLQVLLPMLIGTSGSYEVIVFGMAMVLILKYLPDGIWSLFGGINTIEHQHVLWANAEPLPAKTQTNAGEVILGVNKISKRFGGLLAVNEVSFSIKSGEIKGLIGPNGAGKSTTFNLITGVLPVTSGEVSFLGKRVEHLSMREISQLGISRTFQHVKMIPEMSVLENIAIGAHTRGHAGITAALTGQDKREESRIFKEAHKQLLRVGLGNYMNEPAGNLPMGPQRLMEIARALCADPTLLLLDEPAAGLRFQEKNELAQVIKNLKAEGVSVLLVEHDMDLVMKICDSLVVMEFGNVLVEGSPVEIQNNPQVRAAYLGTEH